MSELHNGVEQWLVAERQQMAQPTALTAFLSKKDEMLASVGFDPDDYQNIGAQKAHSHIDQCGGLINIIDRVKLEPLDRSRKLGELASKALKVASGYSMRTGYFWPSQPEGLYHDRMVELIDDDGDPLPVLGMSVEELDQYALGAFHGRAEIRDVQDFRLFMYNGNHAAIGSDRGLQKLYKREVKRDREFGGSLEAQSEASRLTMEVKALFTSLGIGALRLQDDGPDGLGPIILEPRSDADAHQYLRIADLESTKVDGITIVNSPNPIVRS